MTTGSLIKKYWEQRNPQHETNLDTGKDMFWGTVAAVFNDVAEQLREQKPEANIRWVKASERLPDTGDYTPVIDRYTGEYHLARFEGFGEDNGVTYWTCENNLGHRVDNNENMLSIEWLEESKPEEL